MSQSYVAVPLQFLRLAVGRISPTDLVIIENCNEKPIAYFRKLGVWFDGRSENSAIPKNVSYDENMTKKEFIEVNEVEILPTISPRFDENITRSKRHLPMGNLNLKPSEFSLNQDDRKNAFRHGIITPNTPNMDLKKVVGDARGVNGQKIDPGKRGGWATVNTPLKPPRRISTKIMSNRKPQTPEYKKILRRIKEKKDQDKPKSDQKCDSEILRGADHVKIETADLKKKNDMDSKTKILKNMFEINEKVKISEGGPQSTTNPLKNRGQIGRKMKGKKQESINDPKQPKLESFWGKQNSEGTR